MKLTSIGALAALVGVARAAQQVDYDVAYDQGTGVSSYHADNTHCKSGEVLEAVSEWKSFDDGSHHQKLHKNNLKCGWQIKAKPGQKIEFRFTRFAVQDPICPNGGSFKLEKKKLSFQMQYEDYGVDLHYTGGCKGGAEPKCVEGVKFFNTAQDRNKRPDEPDLFFCGDVYLFEYPWKCDVVYDGKTMCAKNHVTDMDGATGTNSKIQASAKFGWNFADAANGDYTGVQRTGDADSPNFGADAAYCEFKTYKPAPAYDMFQGTESYQYLKDNCNYLFFNKNTNHYCVEEKTVKADAVVNGKCVWNKAKVQTRPSFHHLNTPGNAGEFQKKHLDWGVFTQRTNSLFVDFETDGVSSDYGWEIAYRAVDCDEGEECACTIDCKDKKVKKTQPAWANYNTCPHTRCKYTNENGKSNTKIFHGYAENGALWNSNFHCEHLEGYGAHNCKCVCDDAFTCSMTHHSANGKSSHYNACAEKQMGQRWPPSSIMSPKPKNW